MLEGAVGPAIDIVAVVLGSGGTIRRAVQAVADDGPDPVHSIFGAVLDRSAGGVLLADALASASAELGPAFHPLLGALVAGEADGAPLQATLDRLGYRLEEAIEELVDASLDAGGGGFRQIGKRLVRRHE